MRMPWSGAALAAALVVAGCATAPQTPVSLNASALQTAGARVGVAVSVLPQPDTFFPGADCLLCIAFASGSNSKLTQQVRTWSTTDIAAVRDDLAKLLRARGLEPVSITQPLDVAKLPDGSKEPGKARKDFGALKGAYQIERLLVVQIDNLGATRNYAAYVPTGEPRATLRGAGYMVNLGTQALEWYEPLDVSVPVSGAWDEPPSYPGLTNAYYQAVEKALDQLRQPFGTPK